MSDLDAIMRSLAELEPAAMEANSDVARIETDLALAKTRRDRLMQVVDGLRALLSEPPAAILPTETGSSYEPDLAVKSPDGRQTVLELKPAVPMRVPSTNLVVEIVSASHDPMTRDDVLEEMTRRGATAGMKNPRNSVGTALYRAVRDERLLLRSDQTYISPKPVGGLMWASDAHRDPQEVAPNG